MYISREEAVDALYKVINSGIIDDTLVDILEETANIIEKEEDGLMLWEAEDEVVDLFVAKREDLITNEWVKHCEELEKKYSFKVGDDDES